MILNKNSLIILSFSFITLFIIHSSSAQIFGFLVFAAMSSKALVLSIFFAMINSFYFSSVNYALNSKQRSLTFSSL